MFICELSFLGCDDCVLVDSTWVAPGRVIKTSNSVPDFLLLCEREKIMGRSDPPRAFHYSHFAACEVSRTRPSRGVARILHWGPQKLNHLHPFGARIKAPKA